MALALQSVFQTFKDYVYGKAFFLWAPVYYKIENYKYRGLNDSYDTSPKHYNN